MSVRAILLTSLLLPAAFVAQNTGPRTSRSAEDALIDSLWRTVDEAPQRTMARARELFRSASTSGSYKGMMNAEQLIGEAFYLQYDLDSAAAYYKRALERSRAENDTKEIAANLTSLGSIAKETHRPQEAMERYDEALDLKEVVHDTSAVIELLLRMGNTMMDIARNDRATALFLDALHRSQIAKDTLQAAHALNSLAIVAKKEKDPERSLAYEDSALAIYRRSGEPFYEAATLNNMGVTLKDLHRHAEADSVYARGLALFTEMGYEPGILSFQLNRAILANLQGRPTVALERGGLARDLAERMGDDNALSDALNAIAQADLALNTPQAALDSAERAIIIAQRIGSLEKEHQAWDTKSRALEALGRPHLALEAYKRYLVLNDSMYQMNKTAEIDRMQLAFETRQKEAAIASLENEVRLDQARKRWLRIGIVALAVAALAILFAVVQRRRRDRQLHAAQLELQQARNEKLTQQLDHKRRELTEKALHLAQKNELMRDLEADIAALKTEHGSEGLNAVANKLRFDKQIDHDWDQFTKAFTELDRSFFDRLTARHASLNRNDLRLCALLTMKLGTKEVAAILNVSDEGVKKARYRLRKKLELATEDDLEAYIAAS